MVQILTALDEARGNTLFHRIPCLHLLLSSHCRTWNTYLCPHPQLAGAQCGISLYQLVLSNLKAARKSINRFTRLHHMIVVTIFLKDGDRKSTRLNSSHVRISYAVFCLKKKKN